MSGTKRYLEAQEDKRLSAIQIAIESGAVKRCMVHDDVLLESEPLDVALEHGAEQFDSGELSGVFDDTDDMDEHIRQVVGEATERCERCWDPD